MDLSARLSLFFSMKLFLQEIKIFAVCSYEILDADLTDRLKLFKICYFY